ncbi:5-(carboxyamino)imidazole ribonucleotide synthase [Erythrobacter litoralis]|jgi:5-(carboxyamino)imidazole ribonucleotide synthase|uniref:N5-carboxyaminoimidazole ribonucleotide synthase n=1 Tax=Erythrobacter litoralis TaxID=39960 RepID=A0A074MYI0_9SPHN|nr:5-(carboxyamino)imidazole ribonucleotide synthase [Erythrobacter litoralis]AOL22081.1 5-(carboxyamino)imidazole ribonucleotide synthase [Erythrobacter litoralis]KEO90662.1 phosphoribosylaminoimidazole carboxylase [Erythrobacter litoralis]MEE4339082.1 5-(carboxyamino)imidazole ribonucleotide synthase [Erythrobacter sp.]
MADRSPLPPGSTIGIFGGGQLGRMLAMSALQLGYRCIGYAPAGDNVAAEACADFFENHWADREALAAFAAKCDVVTWEFENVLVSAVAAIPAERLASAPRALEVAQDRLNEKRFVEDLGGRAAPHMRVESDEDFAQAIERIGTPGILKTVRDGYDGKGQWRVRDWQEAQGVRFPGRRCIYEGLVDFEAEFSVILVRGSGGQIRFWDSTANTHEGGMLVQSVLPAGDLIVEQVGAARELAGKVADALSYVGVMTLEFFATKDGPVFNEMAPRVHNSGHWTIEGAATSQFENHVRAICGLPLGETATRFATIDMRNIVGEQALTAHAILSEEGEPHLHLYGKREVREGRKMGHVTRVGARLK